MPSSTDVDFWPDGTSLPTSSDPSATHFCRSHGPFSPAGSRVEPFEIAVASNDPFRPPALVPAITSTTTRRSSSPRRHKSRQRCAICSSYGCDFGAVSWPDARRIRSSSCVTPPIQTARLTPPFSTSAIRIS